jgi:uncharacterized protein (TIGR02246 family)
MRRLLSLVLIPLVWGCYAPTEEAVGEMTAARTAMDVEADFEALRADWQALAIADDAAGVADYYTEDAVFTDAFGNIFNGRAAIQGYFEGSFATATDLSIETTDVLVHGDMVAGYGTFTQTAEGPDGDMVMTGMWQTVSMYQPDGSVKIVLHQSMLPAEPPPM